jgi:hypothetical protein
MQAVESDIGMSTYHFGRSNAARIPALAASPHVSRWSIHALNFMKKKYIQIYQHLKALSHEFSLCEAEPELYRRLAACSMP